MVEWVPQGSTRIRQEVEGKGKVRGTHLYCDFHREEQEDSISRFKIGQFE